MNICAFPAFPGRHGKDLGFSLSFQKKFDETKIFMTNLMETKMNFKVYLDSVFCAIEMDQSAEFPTVDDIVKRFQALFESR